MTAKTITKKQLCAYYNISPDTLNTWLRKVPNLEITKGQRIFTPKQTLKIFEHLGE